MTLADEHRIHEVAVNTAAIAVDAARAAGDSEAEAAAVATLTVAAAARAALLVKLRRAATGELSTYDTTRAPGRRFWEPQDT